MLASLIVVPNWIARSDLGEDLFSAGWPVNQVTAEHIQGLPDDDGIAGLSQRRLNNQVLFADNNLILESAPNQFAGPFDGISFSDVRAHEFSIDGHASVPSDSHAIQSEIDSLLRRAEASAVTDTIEKVNTKSRIGDYSAAIDDGAIIVSNLNVGSQTSASSSDGTGSDAEIFQSEIVALSSLAFESSLFRQDRNIVGGEIFPILTTSELGQSEENQNQNTFQHVRTLSPSR